MRKEFSRQPIQEQLECNKDLILEYGVPFATVPYKKVFSLETNYDEGFFEEHAEKIVFDLVEQEKDLGRPGAFVLSKTNYENKERVYEVWSWAD